MDFASPQAPLPQERLSLPAVAAATLLHVALLWFILQTTPVVQVTRQVVYQLLTPITRVADPAPITPPRTPIQAPKPQPMPVTPPRTVTPKAIVETPAPAQPISEPPALEPTVVERPPAKELVRTIREKPLEVAPEKLPPKVQLDALPALLPPVEVIRPEPLPPIALPPVPLPPAPKPEPKPLPEPVAAPAPAPAPVAPPVPAPVAMPAPAAPAAVAPVPTPAPAPTAAAARPAAITPAAPAAVLPGTAVPAPPGVPATSATPIGNTTGAQRPEYPYLMNRQPRQKSYAELAREQLNPGGPRDKFADSVDGAEKPDCMAGNQAGGLLAAPLIAYKAATGKCK